MERYSGALRSRTRWVALMAVSLMMVLFFALCLNSVAAQEPNSTPDDARVYQNLFEYWMCDARDPNWCPNGDDFKGALFDNMYADPTLGGGVDYRWWDSTADPPGWKYHYPTQSGKGLVRHVLDPCETGDPDGTTCPSANNYDVLACTDGTRPVFYHAPGAGSDSDKWIFKIQGGGVDCWDNCPERMLAKVGHRDDFSSAFGANYSTKSSGGIFGDSAANAFRDYNVVMLDKCVGDRNLGDTTVAPYTYTGSISLTKGTGPVYFHGFRIILATLKQLQREQNLNSAEQILFLTQSNGSNGSYHYIDRLTDHVSATLGITAPVYLLAQSFIAPNPEVEYAFEEGNWPASYSAIPTSATVSPGHIKAPNTPNYHACGPGYSSTDPDRRSYNNWVLEGRKTNGAIQCDRSSPWEALGGVDGRKYATEEFEEGYTATYFDIWGVDNGPTETWDESCKLAHAGDDDLRACRDSQHVMTHHLSTPVFMAAQLSDRNLRSIDRFMSMWAPKGNVWWPEDMKLRVEKLAEVISGVESRSDCADTDMGNHGFYIDNTVDHMAVLEMSKLTRKMKANAGAGDGLNYQLQHYLQYWLDPVLSPTVQCLDSNDLYDAEFAPGAPVRDWPDGVKCSSGYYSGGGQPYQACDDPGFADRTDPTLNKADSRFVCTGPAPTVCATGCQFSSIQAAINAAADGATLILAAETFTESVTVSQSLTLQGAGAGATIVQAAGAPGVASTRVVTVSEGVSVTLDGLTIRYGNVTGDGGGILNRGTLTLTHSVVYSNAASYQGGGIHNDGYGKHATLRLFSSEVLSNTATSIGGGIRNYSYMAGGVALAELEASQVTGNSSGAGGGIASYAHWGTAIMTITHSTVDHNVVSNNGGGIQNLSSEAGSAARLTISKSTIAENSANYGGGLHNQGSHYGNTELFISETSLNSNSAYKGGGLYNTGSSTGTATAILSSTTLFDNSAVGGSSAGGGLYNGGTTSSTMAVEIYASTVSSNTSTSNGGGVFNNGTGGVTATMSISRCTYADNAAWSHTVVAGSAIYNLGAALSIEDSIVANSAYSKDVYCSSPTDISYSGQNLIETSQNCGWSPDSDDPRLDPLADNGGETRTHALQPGSPALDDIPAASCGVATDQRGVMRPQNSDCDIGAYEAVTDAWVDDDWSGPSDVLAYDEALVWGANAFDNINDAVDAVTGSTVHVLAGTYTETLTLDKSVSIIGENGAENTIIQAATSRALASSRVITVSSGVTITLEGLTIRYGRAVKGGGLYNEGTLTLTHSTVYSNAVATSGGGIYSGGAGETHLAVEHSSVIRNDSLGNGGGIFNDASTASAYLTIDHSTVTDNAADDYGGGLINLGGSGTASVTVEQSTFSGNTADNGGGIALGGSSGPSVLTLIHTTLSGNSADTSGGGLGSLNATATLSHSILADSTVGGSPGGNCVQSGSTITDGGHNLVEDVTNNCGISGGSDPKLGPLQDNGGSTWTHALQAGSPALDAIPQVDCTAATDQRGVVRPRGSGCDIGAYEAVTEVWVDDDWAGQADVDAHDPTLKWGTDAFGAANDGLTAISGGTIHVLTGTYTETLTIDKPVEILGESGAANTILQAASLPGLAANRVITVTEGVTVTLDGLTIRYGYATGDEPDDWGGGIFNQGYLTITNGTIISNSAVDDGGGIANHADEDKMTVLVLSNSTISDNTTEDNGGGINNRANEGGTATINVSYSTISNNETVEEGDGGGISTFCISGTVAVTLTNSTVSGNTADEDGGGIYNRASNAGGLATFNIISSTISGNAAEGANGGGGIYNKSYSHGPAILNITDSTISSNNAGDVNSGGGILNFTDPFGVARVSITNSTISGNTAGYRGGGIYNEEDSDGRNIVTATHTTLYANSATDSGGGIHMYRGSLVLSKSIVAGSTGGDCTQTGSTITDGGYNLVQDGSCISQPSSLVADPQLGPLQANGGPASGVGGSDPMLSQALLPGSPAIDAVPTSLCPDPADQRGYSRPVGFGCDTGAFETDTFSVAMTKAVDDANPETGQTVTFTIVVSNTGPGTSGLLILDTLAAELSFVGPIRLNPPDAGSVGSAPPVLASGLAISANHQVTITLPVSVSYGLAGGTWITNTASASSAEVVVPVLGSVGVLVGNAPPVAVDDGGTGFGTDEDTAITTGSVLPNDFDPNGDSLSVVGHDTTGTVGQVTDNGDGTFGYDPDGHFEDLAAGEQVTDTFAYTVGDGRGGTDMATVTITIDGVEDVTTYEVFLPVVLRGE